MTILFEIWGGVFYFFNKVFFSRAERSEDERKRQWRIRAWSVYLTGLPAILVLFYLKSNWMAFLVEIGGAPGMLFGLMAAKRGIDEISPWFERIAFGSAILGIGVSVALLGGFTLITQWLEFGLIVGFLFGTWLCGKQKRVGYLFYAFMNVCTCALMFVQEYYFMSVQQVVSLLFVLDAYRMYGKYDSRKA